MAHASSTDPLYTFALVCDDVSHVRYDVGGQYTAHLDNGNGAKSDEKK